MVKCKTPVGLGELRSIDDKESIYTIGNFPGVLVYNWESKSLKYYLYSMNTDKAVIRRVITIVTMWLDKLPSQYN